MLSVLVGTVVQMLWHAGLHIRSALACQRLVVEDWVVLQ